MAKTLEEIREYWDVQVLQCLIKAQILAVKHNEYYGPAIVRSPIQATRHGTPTMGIDQRGKIMYNPDFVKKLLLVTDSMGVTRLSPKRAICVLVHEIMHVLYCHHKRHMAHRLYKILSHAGFNVAMDAEINDKIQHDYDYIKCNGITPQLMKWPPAKRMEDYAEMLYRDMQNQKMKWPDRYNNDNDNNNPGQQQGSSGSNGNQSQNPSAGSGSGNSPDGQDQNTGSNPGGASGDGSGNNSPAPINTTPPDPDKPGPDGMTPKERIIDRLLRNEQIGEMFDSTDNSKATIGDMTGEKLSAECARKHSERSQNRGNQHAYDSEMVKIEKIIYPWQQVLKNIICDNYERKCWGFDHQTYFRCNRRMCKVSKDIIFPAWYGEQVTFNLVIAVDISGSMGDLIKEMYARVKSLSEAISEQSRVTILEVDTEVCRVVDNFDSSEDQIRTGYGGGTDMGCVPVWVKDQVQNHGREMPDLIIVMTDNYTGWDPIVPELKDKVVVLTNNVDKSCPYPQHEVLI